MKITFFQKDGYIDPDAIHAGVYEFKIGCINDSIDNFKSLYIGESYSMIHRCGAHLYEVFHNDPMYFGLTEEHINNNSLELVVKVYEKADILEHDSYSERDCDLRNKEHAAIVKEKPLSQNEDNDRLKSNRVEVVSNAIAEMLRERV